MRPDEGKPVALEERGVRRVHAKRLALEHEVGDPADEVLDGRRSVWPQFHSRHVDSLYRPNQEIFKHPQMFSEAAHTLL